MAGIFWTGGFGTIAAGQQLGFSFNFGPDPGVVYIVPNPLNPGGILRIDAQAKVLNNDGSVSYWVWFTNLGNVTTNFNFQGFQVLDG
jgi:hypothetical protein